MVLNVLLLLLLSFLSTLFGSIHVGPVWEWLKIERWRSRSQRTSCQSFDSYVVHDCLRRPNWQFSETARDQILRISQHRGSCYYTVSQKWAAHAPCLCH